MDAGAPNHALLRPLADTWTVRVSGEDVQCHVVNRKRHDNLIVIAHPDPAMVARAAMVVSSEAVAEGLGVECGNVVGPTPHERDARTWLLVTDWTLADVEAGPWPV